MDHSRISSKWVGVLAGSARIRNVSIPPRFLYCSLIFTCSLVAQATAWLFVFNSYSYEALLPHFSSISLHLWCIFYIAPQHRKTIDEIAVELRRRRENGQENRTGTLDNLQGIIDGMGKRKRRPQKTSPITHVIIKLTNGELTCISGRRQNEIPKIRTSIRETLDESQLINDKCHTKTQLVYLVKIRSISSFLVFSDFILKTFNKI